MTYPSTEQSVLSSLFRRAADPESARDPVEDFTTEALAGAIRRDPRPIYRVMTARVIDTSRVDGQPLTVSTQRTHLLANDAIRLDLVLQWPTQELEIWFEIKTGSPLAFDQLGRYRRAQSAMTEIDGLERPPVVLLSSADLRFTSLGHFGSDAGYIAWQDVVDAVSKTDRPDSLWLELVAFLRERGMTEETTFPITAREAVSLGDSHRLFQKAVKLVTQVNADAKVAFPEVTWWSTGIPVFVQKQFRDKGRYTLGLWNTSRMGLLWGVESDNGDEATYAVWLEADPRYSEVRPEAHRLADAAHLRDRGWEHEYGGWKIVQTRAHTVNFPTIEAAAAWFLDRFSELSDAGLFDLWIRLRTGRPEPEQAGEIDEADSVST